MYLGLLRTVRNRNIDLDAIIYFFFFLTANIFSARMKLGRSKKFRLVRTLRWITRNKDTGESLRLAQTGREWS